MASNDAGKLVDLREGGIVLGGSSNGARPTPPPVGVTEAQVIRTEVDVEENGMEEQWIELAFTWSGKPYNVRIAGSDRVFDLKAQLHNLTHVPPERQKIVGLVKGGKLPPDQAKIEDLNLMKGKKFQLIGTPEGDEIKDPSRLEFLPDVVNDLDVDFSADPAAAVAYQNDQRNKRKIREVTQKLSVNVINPLREGKKLLVLDIDYTILDTKPLTSGALPPAECLRPRLHEFLEAIYPYYDICVWSQTSWVWIETKLVEMGMFDAERNYKIAFIMDKTSMFTVFSSRHGKEWTHQVKALQIIWNTFPQYNEKNTIHLDDLGRNFALNPKCGLKVRAFKNCHTAEGLSDRELDKIARYMIYITENADFTTLRHKDWELLVRGLPPS